MTKVFKVGDRVMLEGVLEHNAKVFRVNGNGTVDIIWDLGGYTCNLNPDELIKLTEEV